MIETARTIALIRLLSGGTPAAKVQKATTENMQALLESSWIADNAVTGTAYAATVPSGSLPWATLSMIGGKTIVWNQLVGYDEDEKITSKALPAGAQIISGHKYYARTTFTGTNTIQTSFYTKVSGSATLICYISTATPEKIFTAAVDATSDGTSLDGDGKLWIYATTPTDTDYGTNMVLCDLTLMFGSGNEPSTVADFTAMFPAVYYAYNSGELKSAAVTQMVTADSNATQIGTYAIPAAIQALEGYGWSAGSVYNYIDYANKKYVQNVGRVVLDGTETWAWDSYNSLVYTIISDAYVVDASTQQVVTTITDNSAMVNQSWAGRASSDFTVGPYYGQPRIYAKSTGFTAASDAVTYFTSNPTTVNYILETPIETDISALLTDADALINVEAGGSVTFKNSLGDDYRIPVPSTVTYAENLIPSVPSSDGTYTLTATVSDGDVTYSWA